MGPLSKLLRQMGLISNTPTTITQKKKRPNWSTIYKSSSSNRKQPLNCIFKSNCLNLLIQLHGTETKLETTKTLAICFQSENLKVYFYLIWLSKVKTHRKKNEREKLRVRGFIYIYIYIRTSWGFSVAKEEAHVSRLMLKCADGVRYFLSFLLSFLALIYVGCFRSS